MYSSTVDCRRWRAARSNHSMSVEAVLFDIWSTQIYLLDKVASGVVTQQQHPCLNKYSYIYSVNFPHPGKIGFVRQVLKKTCSIKLTMFIGLKPWQELELAATYRVQQYDPFVAQGAQNNKVQS